MQFITKKRSKKVIAAVTAIILIPTAAFAAWFLLKGMTGSVKTAAGVTLDSVSISGTTGLNCIPSKSGENVNVAITEALPGSRCDIRVNYVGKVGSEFVVQSASFDDGGMVDALVSAASCGKPVDSLGKWAVDIRVQVSADAPMNTTIPAGPSAGIKFVTTDDYVAAECNSY